ncbi:ABZJ_00895 family protein [Psychrobacter sp. S1-30-MNA-CIBAN-0213]|uniref:ABZJ_00895 family protein n=1 Tax=unclassified Psychrobacter TaxID=196806 RepID=UPI00331E864D
MARKTTKLSKSNTQSGRNGLSQNSKSTQPKMAQYIGFFAIGYIITSTIFMMIQTQVALNSQLVTVLSIMVGAYIAVNKFIKHQQRALDRDEINRLMFGGVGVVWLLTAIYFLGIWFLLFDAVSREVLLEMTMQQPLPLLSALVMILVLTFISARISILLLNRLLDPKRKTS